MCNNVVKRQMFGSSIAPTDSNVPKKGLFITQKVVLICIFFFITYFITQLRLHIVDCKLQKTCKTEMNSWAAVSHYGNIMEVN